MKKYHATQRFLQFVFIMLLGSTSCFLPQQAFAGGTTNGNTNNYFRQTITGTVKDATTGKGLPGATIIIKGTSQSATTDATGAFSLTVSDERVTLIITFVGYQSKEVTVSGNSPVSISLQPGTNDLAQVVVVGYGTQSKKDITGSVKSIRSEAFNKGIINAPQQLLQGKVAGVNVTSASGEPGGTLNITVRGPGGIRTGSTPLFVIDGLPMDNSSTGGGDPLNFINPQDIESIDVLKDASATAIYGSRGANGVIIITTRKGRSGASTLNWSSSVGISKLARPLEVLSADEFRKEVPAVGGVLDDKGGNTDWQKEVTRTALTHQHNLSLSGGADKLTYYASFGVLQQQGIVKKNDLSRYSGRFNASQRLLEDRLVVDVNLAVAQTRNNRPNFGTILGSAITNNPTYPVYDGNGNLAAYPNMTNPVLALEQFRDVITINRVVGNISPSVKIIKGLTYRLNFGVDYSNSTRDSVTMPSTTPPNTGRLQSWYNWNRNTLIENYLTYNFKVKEEHEFSALAGYSYQKFFIQGRNSSINNFSNTSVDPIYNPGLGEELTLAQNRPGGFALINELQSYFGRVTYQFMGKYLATVNFRADGSSKFGANNKYGYFPSFSLGWKITDEEFMKNSFFDLLKLRAGWGMTGNQEIPSKITQAYFTSQSSASNSYPLYGSGPYPSGTVYNRLANPNIQWEVSKQTNIGLDFSVLRGALSGSVDVFRKVSDNILLLIIPADPVQPVTTTWTNVENMSITNQGLEFDVDYRHKTSFGLNFNVGGNFTYLTNEVKNSPFTVIASGSATGAGLTSSTINGYVNGEPIGTFFLREWTGLDANGINTFRDLNDDKLFNDKDRIAAGTALPNVLYNFYASATYKGFDLTANFNGVSGNKVYDLTANTSFYKSQLSKNINVTRKAFEYPNESLSNTAPVSTRYLKDGSYLRLNNVVLGYTFNTDKLGFGRWVKSLRTSLTAQNLFVITKYDGYDPEVNTDRTIDGVSSYGIDYGAYPKSRSFIFSVNVSF